MTTFQEDLNAAQREVNGMPDLPAKKVTRTKRVKKARPVNMEPPGQHTNKLKKRGPSKKVLSENAKAQPRSNGKFGKKGPGFFTRLGWLLTGKARRKVNASIRTTKRQTAARGQAVIPAQRKRRKRK